MVIDMADKRKKAPDEAAKAAARASTLGTVPGANEKRSQTDNAYDRIEHAIVHLEFKPGEYTTIAEIQERTGFGRTPVLDAVRKLADATLVTVMTRRGLQITPIRPDRERHLLVLRRDVERFVVQLAAERANSVQRSQMNNIVRALNQHASSGNIRAFNDLDCRLDMLILEAAGEPLAKQVLRPIQSIFRRTGYVYLAHLDPRGRAFADTVRSHANMLTAIAEGRSSDAALASGNVVSLAETMFDSLSDNIDPTLLDASIEPLPNLLTESFE